MRRLVAASVLLAAGCMISSATAAADDNATTAPWSVKQAHEWYDNQPWLVGSNFAPSTAVNQLEMWQADTFDPETIDRELGYAESLGFSSMRVFLHHMLWVEDSKGFLDRMEKFLDIAEKHHIGVMFVLFDSVWDPFPHPGKQPEPKPSVHNSGWVQSPGAEVLKDPSQYPMLKEYVQGVVGHFKNDKRVQVWDVWNEPDNPVPQYKDVELPNKNALVRPLLQKTFAWAREMNPVQPLTSGVWTGPWPEDDVSPMEKIQLENSDVVSFHSYGKPDDMKKAVESLKRFKRPLICTEYMARPIGSTFDPILGYLKAQHIGAYNWGFVSGKSQTIFPWDSWEKKYGEEPPVWFHDIFRTNGKPYRQKEVDYIRSLTGAEKSGENGSNAADKTTATSSRESDADQDETTGTL